MSKSAEKEEKKLEKNNNKNNNSKHAKVINFQDNSYSEKIQKLHIPRWEELPSIDLYLDQLVTLIDNCFSPYLNEEDGPIITKTMINNVSE